MATKTKKKGAKEKAPKPPKIRKTEEATIPVQHTFSSAERDEIARDMAAKMTTRVQVDDQLKAIAADYKSRLKTIDAEISQRHSAFTLGYEFRETRVIVHFNKATDDKTKKPYKKTGWKRIVRADDGSWIKDEPMTAVDMNAELFEKKKVEEESRRAKAAADAKEKQAVDDAAAKKKKEGELPLNAPDVPTECGKTSTAAKA